MDPPKSESPTQQNPCGGDRQTVDSVEFPPVRPKNLIRLGEDLLRASLIPATGMSYPVGAEDRQYLSLVSDMISRDRYSPTGLSPEESEALAETFRKVNSPHWALSQSLTPLVVRPHRSYLLCQRIIQCWTYGADFMHTPSSVNHKFSPA